ncbi:calcium-binding and coiled-coil domain-containing protein 2 [Tribolium castaneum]|uniref:Tax1-binding protein 1 homolog-like Protein n=1 Tax=Tribolium castaneum TaxID=7070 RepID=D6WWI3_TRICA|nr:PREDICTED: calcium-binding and coiled-coil domain-containing protein 2 [Tribolium castaneum]EFA08133.1 Tax1-binding protein 1 homolog-like Protein [Tribolium castaneum]|eukprot:XP_974426.1 PREDICTED: calcium-binding and coiled-coil domain-containing protein 2 [Tribolium castaneum]
MDTSIALMADQLTVKFVDTLDRYPCNEDIECKYTFNNYKVQDGDRIAIFKTGWKSLRNYVLFEWAVDSSVADVNSVVFSRYDLPNSPSETDDLYQFCYISGENVVQGISTPFQIYSFDSKHTVNLTDSLKNENQCTHLKQLLAHKDKEILRLKEENAILKESLKSMVDQRKFQRSKNYDDDIEQLKELTSKLKNVVLGQQKEIDALKSEVRKDKAEQKNLLLEKKLAERRFESACGKNVKRLNIDFDLGSLQSLPAFPFDDLDKM